jgi:hypothetical protein
LFQIWAKGRPVWTVFLSKFCFYSYFHILRPLSKVFPPAKRT